MMRPFILFLLALPLLAACATPGYDYSARMVPTFPEAVAYRDVSVGRFRGPAGDVAESEFARMLDETTLDGAHWFGIAGSDGRRGVYDGEVHIESWEAETRFERKRECVEYDAPFDCEHRAIVETECTEETVEVSVTATLRDRETGRRVFTQTQGGGANHETCVDVAQYEDEGQTLGVWRDPVHSSYSAWDAPYGMVADATVEAVRRFRTDIAPYDATVRAEIMTKGLIPEEQNDPRFQAAVDATKRGEMLGACAQWDALARDWPDAPAILHNLGACAEARGDMTTAQLRYARAAEIAQHIPLLKDQQAQPIFDALARVSGRRMDDTFLNRATDSPEMPDVPAAPPAESGS
ncbi:MAG TPA: hypothetical protein PLR76_04605 [Hyphomonas sp.]|nr:hypothetical protein [Hyphomonas sp.]MCB9963146.1 hypothetical protein [Hyphomonas sp.]MCB9970104.1 hypothetical protein [Hyphomonas sp.]HPE47650.1 hypothetical protein [Hyphomonas sp.]